MEEKSVFFRNLRAEVVRKYGCGGHLGWINLLANALGWSFDKTKTVIYRYQNFEPQQMIIPHQIAQVLDLPVDRLVYDPRNASRDSYYWKSNDYLAEKAALADSNFEQLCEELNSERERNRVLRAECLMLKLELDNIKGRVNG